LLITIVNKNIRFTFDVRSGLFQFAYKITTGYLKNFRASNLFYRVSIVLYLVIKLDYSRDAKISLHFFRRQITHLQFHLATYCFFNLNKISYNSFIKKHRLFA